MNTHELKIMPEYLTAVIEGKKTFEVRKADRDYKVGDKLWLKEWNGKAYTERFAIVDVTYILDNPEYVKEGYVILGIKNASDSEAVKFACAVDKVIGLPGCVCEVYEKAFKEGKYEEIVRNLVNFYKKNNATPEPIITADKMAVLYDEIKPILVDMFRRKNADYGDSFGNLARQFDQYFGECVGLIPCLGQIAHKMNRAKQMAEDVNGGKSPNFEGLVATLKDMASYCLMTAIVASNYDPEKFKE